MEDFVVINETVFFNVWMDVRDKNETWLLVLGDILLMRENLDLGWILPRTYSSLWAGGGIVVEFLNRVAGDRWSRLEMTMDGETRESPDGRPLETRVEDGGTREEVPTIDDALLLEVPATKTMDIASSDTLRTWMQ